MFSWPRLPGSGGIVEDDSTVPPERTANMPTTTTATDAPRISIAAGARNPTRLPDFYDSDLDPDDELQCEYLLARTVRDRDITRRPVRMTVHYGRSHRQTRTYVLE